MTARRHAFVAPPLDGPPTGGTLYNAHLVGALRRASVRCERVALEGAERAAAVPETILWVDSLYLEALPRLARTSAPANVLLHYLPSLVTAPNLARPSELTEEERRALETARSVLVTSAWARQKLLDLGVPSGKIGVVEPGTDGVVLARERAAGAPLEALIVANLLPGKGVLPFLEALASRLSEEDPVRLAVVGSSELDPGYAARCHAVVESTPLSRRVRFTGALPFPELAELLARSDVLVSASRMETYGMALSAARASGVPILARRGGNVAEHVEERAGCALFDDDVALARALVALAADPLEAARRRELAGRARPERSWDEAARDFVRFGGR